MENSDVQSVQSTPIPHISPRYFLLVISMIILLCITGLGGYFLGKDAEYGHPVAPMSKHAISPSPTTQTIIPRPSFTSGDELIQAYYNWYFACIQQHTTRASLDFSYNESPQEACPYNTGNTISASLFNKLQPAPSDLTGSNPILCAQNIPEKITFDTPIASSSRVDEGVNTFWLLGPSPKKIEVTAVQQEGAWKISSIVCK